MRSPQFDAPAAAGLFLAPGDTDFALRGTFVFPNPAKGGSQPTLHVEVGQADSVELKIYDITGRLLKDVTLTQAPTLVDSGDGLRLAYEYIWDDRIASGIYFYTVRAVGNTFIAGVQGADGAGNDQLGTAPCGAASCDLSSTAGSGANVRIASGTLRLAQ